MKVLACKTPYGVGGLGQHFRQLVEEARASGTLAAYFAHSTEVEDPYGHSIPRGGGMRLLAYTPLRFSPSWMSYLAGELFDRSVATRLKEIPPAESFVGFAGKALHSFRQARSLGYERLELVAPNSHVQNVQRQHRQARVVTGLDDTWLNGAQVRKTLREYEEADGILVHSDYVRQTFIEAGVREDRLVSTRLTVDPRFAPPETLTRDGVFRVVYVGRIEATKGIPLLLAAFMKLEGIEAQLTLVGGCSPPMRRYLDRVCARHARIRLTSGDPLPHLQEADVFVHPSFEDGFGYAPMEALACGVPVIVTEDTGMKEYVVEGVNGYAVPTGDTEAILARMTHLIRHPLKQAGLSLLVREPQGSH